MLTQRPKVIDQVIEGQVRSVLLKGEARVVSWLSVSHRVIQACLVFVQHFVQSGHNENCWQRIAAPDTVEKLEALLPWNAALVADDKRD